jgi:hypothetical protein
MIRADRMSASQQRSPYCSTYPLDLESDGLTSIPYRRRGRYRLGCLRAQIRR